MALCNPDGNGPHEAGAIDGVGDVNGGIEGNLDIRVPEIDTQYGEPLWRQKRGIAVEQGSCAYLQLAMRDGHGNNIDLTDYGLYNNDDNSPTTSESSSSGGTVGSIKARWREASLIDSNLYQTTPTIVDAANGIVKSIIPSQISDATGIYLAQFAILNDADCPRFMNDCYVYVLHSAWYSDAERRKGPPLIDDVRLSIRDSDPVLNELLDEYAFDVGEISFAATRAVQYWNDQPPVISAARYSTKTFPFREIWLSGIQLFLFEMAEEHFRRNAFKVSAGGTITDDMNKYREYNSAWKERFQRYTEMLMHRKAQINLSRGWGWLDSGYPGRLYL